MGVLKVEGQGAIPGTGNRTSQGLETSVGDDRMFSVVGTQDGEKRKKEKSAGPRGSLDKAKLCANYQFR